MSANKNHIISKNYLERFAFIGQKIYFEKTVFEGTKEGITSNFLPYTYDAPPADLVKVLEAVTPEVLIIYRPEVFDKKLLQDLKKDFLTVGFFTEPLPYEGFEAEFDLARRYEPFRKFDFESCDFYVTYNPITCQALEGKAEILFSHPIPVGDHIFKSKAKNNLDIRGIFYGRVTPERNRYLMPLKHTLDLTVIDHGYFDESFFENYNVALNLHSDSYPNFENRVFHHMAQSMLVLSEPLLPNYGLKDEVHYFEFDNEVKLNDLLVNLSQDIEKRIKVTRAGFDFTQTYSSTNFIKKLKEVLELKVKDYEL